ncbi:gluconate 2-dehydrogenase subunit 3 family protein [Rhodothermus profundi]|uniref:Gluconate 2-dehydrogenase subunit 3 n=1 Tax=Rhodothermus profundi TaxID=633813 RepID=A0A1M6WES4_9BACT|nr:gluconate 2-dehydrogenase subunit 3 family protein [Rhodothermus profundi]SHK91995.1 Gluconate 2-dehydrogenase subunit 3 [Rhodothermus profundi]
MDRREALRQLALLTGGALSLSTVAGVLGGCRAGSAPGTYRLQTLSTAQHELVATIAERILPETDTPGARAAGVPEFIDRMLTDWMYAAEREHFLRELARVDALAQERFGQPFVQASEEQQVQLLRELEEEARHAEPQRVVIDRSTGQIVDGPDTSAEDMARGRPPRTLTVELRPFFRIMKELTIVGYYTSEVGATQELQLNLVPGRYDACVPYEQIGRAWA